MLASACGRAAPLTEQEKKRVNEMTMDMKTRCVGRYVIDMPAVFLPAGTAKFGDASVQAQAMTLEEFNTAVEERAAKMTGTKSVMGFRFLYDYGEVPNVKRTQYFVSLGDYGSSSDATRIIEAYKWDDGYQLTLRLEALDFTHSFVRDVVPLEQLPVQNDLPEKARIAFDLIARLQGRPDDVVPGEPGACFFGGFLKGKASGDEEINSSFVIADKPDVWFSFESFTNLSANDTLLQRVHGNEMRALFKATNGRLIRSGTIALEGGLKADEALMSGRSPATALRQLPVACNVS
ncbi:hypothetical protein ASG35_29620, partial [Burkholderia sp. Leaf177]